MRSLCLVLLCLCTSIIFAQHTSGHICSRSVSSSINAPNTDKALNNRTIESECTLIHVEQFAYLTSVELYQYITSVDAPFTCITRVLSGYNSVFSRVVFSDQNVNYIAQLASNNFNNYSGTLDNGTRGLIAYLSLAAQMSRYYSEVEYTDTTWDYIEDAISTLARNPNILLVEEINFWILGELFVAASDERISGNNFVVYLAYRMLDKLANNSYVGLEDYYPYYYCYYYILEVYLLYAVNSPAYIANVANDPRLIYALTDIINNHNLNADTYIYFGELVSSSVKALANHAQYDAISGIVSNALQEVVNTFDPYSTEWVIASIAIVENDLVAEYPYTEEEIINSLEDDQFPNTYLFENGNIEVSTPLSYEEILPLYEAAEIVRAQFFRMLGTDAPLESDINDKLTIKVFGTMSEYQDFNVILYGVDYPNSGGVYIEDYATFYTYQRTPEESDYSLEELFRHEYVHYLQGRYLVPGNWGDSPIYDDQRMVWFEEGMAQFLAGSTRYEGVKNLNVIRWRLENFEEYQDLSQIFSSSYSSGNSDAYYTFSPMLWSDLYHNNRSVMYNFCNHIRTGDVAAFDQEVNNYRNSGANQSRYDSHIASQLSMESAWVSPVTDYLHQHDVDQCTEAQILNEFSFIDQNLILESAAINYEGDQARYIVEMTKEFSADEYNTTKLKEKTDNYLNDVMYGAELFSSCNAFDFSKAYFTGVVTGDVPTADVVFSLRLNDDGSECRAYTEHEFSAVITGENVISFYIHTVTTTHQFRYKEAGTTAWIALPQSSNAVDIISAILDPNRSYDYQVRRECSPGEWSEYSEVKVIHPCPDSKELYATLIDEDATIQTANYIKTSSAIINSAEVYLSAGSYITLLPAFVIDSGSSLEIVIENCRSAEQ